MADLKTWTTTAGGNNQLPPDGFPENMDRPDVNNSARETMAAVRRWYDDPEFIDINRGSAVSRDSATVVRISGVDLTTYYIADRRIELRGAGDTLGFVQSSTFSGGDTLVTVDLDGGAVVPIGTNEIVVSAMKSLLRSAWSGGTVDFVEIDEFTR